MRFSKFRFQRKLVSLHVVGCGQGLAAETTTTDIKARSAAMHPCHRSSQETQSRQAQPGAAPA
eukprot:scaffold79165_cov30-Prasinocladus_malaysianus.AAC.1